MQDLHETSASGAVLPSTAPLSDLHSSGIKLPSSTQNSNILHVSTVAQSTPLDLGTSDRNRNATLDNQGTDTTKSKNITDPLDSIVQNEMDNKISNNRNDNPKNEIELIECIEVNGNENNENEMGTNPSRDIPAIPLKFPADFEKVCSTAAAPRHLKKAWLQRHTTGEDCEYTSSETNIINDATESPIPFENNHYFNRTSHHSTNSCRTSSTRRTGNSI